MTAGALPLAPAVRAAAAGAWGTCCRPAVGTPGSQRAGDPGPLPGDDVAPHATWEATKAVSIGALWRRCAGGWRRLATAALAGMPAGGSKGTPALAASIPGTSSSPKATGPRRAPAAPSPGPSPRRGSRLPPSPDSPGGPGGAIAARPAANPLDGRARPGAGDLRQPAGCQAAARSRADHLGPGPSWHGPAGRA